MSLTACYLLKTAYQHVPKNPGVPQESASVHIISHVLILEVIPLSPVRASLEPYVREATFFLLIKKKPSQLGFELPS